MKCTLECTASKENGQDWLENEVITVRPSCVKLAFGSRYNHHHTGTSRVTIWNKTKNTLRFRIILPQTDIFQVFSDQREIFGNSQATIFVKCKANGMHIVQDSLEIQVMNYHILRIPLEILPSTDWFTLPKFLTLPPTPLGQRGEARVNLPQPPAGLKSTYQFQILSPLTPMFTVQPRSGMIGGANGLEYLTVSFQATEYITVVYQLRIKFLLQGSLAEHFEMNICGRCIPNPETEALAKDTAGIQGISPELLSQSQKKPQKPKIRIKKSHSKLVAGGPNPTEGSTDLLTPAGVAKFLLKKDHSQDPSTMLGPLGLETSKSLVIYKRKRDEFLSERRKDHIHQKTLPLQPNREKIGTCTEAEEEQIQSEHRQHLQEYEESVGLAPSRAADLARSQLEKTHQIPIRLVGQFQELQFNKGFSEAQYLQELHNVKRAVLQPFIQAARIIITRWRVGTRLEKIRKLLAEPHATDTADQFKTAHPIPPSPCHRDEYPSHQDFEDERILRKFRNQELKSQVDRLNARLRGIRDAVNKDLEGMKSRFRGPVFDNYDIESFRRFSHVQDFTTYLQRLDRAIQRIRSKLKGEAIEAEQRALTILILSLMGIVTTDASTGAISKILRKYRLSLPLQTSTGKDAPDVTTSQPNEYKATYLGEPVIPDEVFFGDSADAIDSGRKTVPQLDYADVDNAMMDVDEAMVGLHTLLQDPTIQSARTRFHVALANDLKVAGGFPDSAQATATYGDTRKSESLQNLPGSLLASSAFETEHFAATSHPNHRETSHLEHSKASHPEHWKSPHTENRTNLEKELQLSLDAGASLPPGNLEHHQTNLTNQEIEAPATTTQEHRLRPEEQEIKGDHGHQISEEKMSKKANHKKSLARKKQKEIHPSELHTHQKKLKPEPSETQENISQAQDSHPHTQNTKRDSTNNGNFDSIQYISTSIPPLPTSNFKDGTTLRNIRRSRRILSTELEKLEKITHIPEIAAEKTEIFYILDSEILHPEPHNSTAADAASSQPDEEVTEDELEWPLSTPSPPLNTPITSSDIKAQLVKTNQGFAILQQYIQSPKIGHHIARINGLVEKSLADEPTDTDRVTMELETAKDGIGREIARLSALLHQSSPPEAGLVTQQGRRITSEIDRVLGLDVSDDPESLLSRNVLNTQLEILQMRLNDPLAQELLNDLTLSLQLYYNSNNNNNNNNGGKGTQNHPLTPTQFDRLKQLRQRLEREEELSPPLVNLVRRISAGIDRLISGHKAEDLREKRQSLKRDITTLQFDIPQPATKVILTDLNRALDPEGPAGFSGDPDRYELYQQLMALVKTSPDPKVAELKKKAGKAFESFVKTKTQVDQHSMNAKSKYEEILGLPKSIPITEGVAMDRAPPSSERVEAIVKTDSKPSIQGKAVPPSSGVEDVTGLQRRISERFRRILNTSDDPRVKNFLRHQLKANETGKMDKDTEDKLERIQKRHEERRESLRKQLLSLQDVVENSAARRLYGQLVKEITGDEGTSGSLSRLDQLRARLNAILKAVKDPVITSAMKIVNDEIDKLFQGRFYQTSPIITAHRSDPSLATQGASATPPQAERSESEPTNVHATAMAINPYPTKASAIKAQLARVNTELDRLQKKIMNRTINKHQMKLNEVVGHLLGEPLPYRPWMVEHYPVQVIPTLTLMGHRERLNAEIQKPGRRLGSVDISSFQNIINSEIDKLTGRGVALDLSQQITPVPPTPVHIPENELQAHRESILNAVEALLTEIPGYEVQQNRIHETIDLLFRMLGLRPLTANQIREQNLRLRALEEHKKITDQLFDLVGGDYDELRRLEMLSSAEEDEEEEAEIISVVPHDELATFHQREESLEKLRDKINSEYQNLQNKIHNIDVYKNQVKLNNIIDALTGRDSVEPDNDTNPDVPTIHPKSWKHLKIPLKELRRLHVAILIPLGSLQYHFPDERLAHVETELNAVIRKLIKKISPNIKPRELKAYMHQVTQEFTKLREKFPDQPFDLHGVEESVNGAIRRTLENVEMDSIALADSAQPSIASVNEQFGLPSTTPIDHGLSEETQEAGFGSEEEEEHEEIQGEKTLADQFEKGWTDAKSVDRIRASVNTVLDELQINTQDPEFAVQKSIFNRKLDEAIGLETTSPSKQDLTQIKQDVETGLDKFKVQLPPAHEETMGTIRRVFHSLPLEIPTDGTGEHHNFHPDKLTTIKAGRESVKSTHKSHSSNRMKSKSQVNTNQLPSGGGQKSLLEPHRLSHHTAKGDEYLRGAAEHSAKKSRTRSRSNPKLITSRFTSKTSKHRKSSHVHGQQRSHSKMSTDGPGRLSQVHEMRSRPTPPFEGEDAPLSRSELKGKLGKRLTKEEILDYQERINNGLNRIRESTGNQTISALQERFNEEVINILMRPTMMELMGPDSNGIQSLFSVNRKVFELQDIAHNPKLEVVARMLESEVRNLARMSTKERFKLPPLYPKFDPKEPSHPIPILELHHFRNGIEERFSKVPANLMTEPIKAARNAILEIIKIMEETTRQDVLNGSLKRLNDEINLLQAKVKNSAIGHHQNGLNVHLLYLLNLSSHPNLAVSTKMEFQSPWKIPLSVTPEQVMYHQKRIQCFFGGIPTEFKTAKTRAIFQKLDMGITFLVRQLERNRAKAYLDKYNDEMDVLQRKLMSGELGKLQEELKQEFRRLLAWKEDVSAGIPFRDRTFTGVQFPRKIPVDQLRKYQEHLTEAYGDIPLHAKNARTHVIHQRILSILENLALQRQPEEYLVIETSELQDRIAREVRDVQNRLILQVQQLDAADQKLDLLKLSKFQWKLDMELAAIRDRLYHEIQKYYEKVKRHPNRIPNRTTHLKTIKTLQENTVSNITNLQRVIGEFIQQFRKRHVEEERREKGKHGKLNHNGVKERLKDRRWRRKDPCSKFGLKHVRLATESGRGRGSRSGLLRRLCISRGQSKALFSSANPSNFGISVPPSSSRLIEPLNMDSEGVMRSDSIQDVNCPLAQKCDTSKNGHLREYDNSVK